MIFFSDKDECSEGNGGCELTCMNLIGGFQCGCLDGYTVGDDGRTCIGMYVYTDGWMGGWMYRIAGYFCEGCIFHEFRNCCDSRN